MGKRARSKSFGKHKPKPTEPEILEGRAIDLACSIQDWIEWLGIVASILKRRHGLDTFALSHLASSRSSELGSSPPLQAVPPL
jgi:hypothetical protein